MKIDELFKKEIHMEISRQVRDITVRKKVDTPLENFDVANKKYVDGKVASGSSGSVTLAKLTGGGSTGSLTFVNGLITSFSAPS